VKEVRRDIELSSLEFGATRESERDGRIERSTEGFERDGGSRK